MEKRTCKISRMWEMTILGSGGWIPTGKRETCSALFKKDKKGLIIDCGTGIRHLLNRDLTSDLDEVAVILTHFHLDHVAGLGYLEAVLDKAPVIYAPGEMLYKSSSERIIKTFVSDPYLSAPFEKTFKESIELEEDQEILGMRVFSRMQRFHSIPTAALRIENDIAYITDTSYDEENIEFIKGSAVLFHEAWYQEESMDSITHSSGAEAGKIARESEVDSLYLIHINPEGDEEKVLGEAQRVFPESFLGHDLETIGSISD